jgi:hypothetical protein
MRRSPADRRDRLAGLFVVVGATIVFAPAIWFVQRWSEAVARDPSDAWGAPWLGENLTAHPYLTAGVLLLGVMLSSGVIMLIIVRVAKRLAARVTGRGQSPASGGHEDDLRP